MTENIKQTIAESWSIDIGELDNCEIIFNMYYCASYEGVAFCVFIKDGILYECNGSHCSCNGLEGQWQPEETTFDALRVRNYDSLTSDLRDDDPDKIAFDNFLSNMEVEHVLLKDN